MPDVLLGLAFAPLPSLRPEVRLGGVDETLPAKHDLVRVAYLGEKDITLGGAGASPHVCGEGDLAIPAQRQDRGGLCHSTRIAEIPKLRNCEGAPVRTTRHACSGRRDSPPVVLGGRDLELAVGVAEGRLTV